MIYTEFWGLQFPPFANDNRPETFVPTHSAALAISRLRYALGMGMGASALFGAPGVGKTRVARLLQQDFIAAHWLTAYLPNPFASARDILLALDPHAHPESGLPDLQSFLLTQAAEKQPVVVMVDDVQAARGGDFLEMLRTLLNLERDGIKVLSLLLIGQADMDRRLAAASNFDSQLVARAVLEPMSDEESRLYVLARLKAAGSRQGIFTKQAAELIVKYARGLPRQVNRLCEMALVIAYGLEENRVSPDVIDMAAADLDLLPAGEASFFPWPHPEPEEEPEEDEETGEEDILASLSAEPAVQK